MLQLVIALVLLEQLQLDARRRARVVLKYPIPVCTILLGKKIQYLVQYNARKLCLESKDLVATHRQNRDKITDGILRSLFTPERFRFNAFKYPADSALPLPRRFPFAHETWVSEPYLCEPLTDRSEWSSQCLSQWSAAPFGDAFQRKQQGSPVVLRTEAEKERLRAKPVVFLGKLVAFLVSPPYKPVIGVSPAGLLSADVRFMIF